MSTLKRIGLVAGVDSQPSVPSPALDLYRSSGFLAARRQVESTCGAWFILSPRYGLAAPNDWLEPYSQTMADLSEREREEWSARVLAQLEEKLGELKGRTFELHAGPEFYEHGLLDGLRKAKAKVEIAGREGADADESQDAKAEPAPKPSAVDAPRPGRRRKKTAAAVVEEVPPARIEMPASERRELLDRLYELLEEQAEVIGGRWRLPDCSGDDHWPQHGVVFFFQPGELREDGQTPRVVRVSTHATTPSSKTRLWDRLRSDRGSISGANPGSGNHRASALRRHIGRALIERDGYPEAAASWGSAGSVDAETKQREMELEIAVSRIVADMEFIWLAVPEAEDRHAIEKGAVALLSNRDREPVDPPGPEWIGHYAGPVISASGLWNVDFTREQPDPAVLDVLRRHIEA